MLSLFLWGLQARAIGAAPPPTPTAIPICGTPHFHEWTVWAAQNLPRRFPSSEELRAKGKLDAQGNILADTVGQQRTFWAYNWVTDTDYQLTATCKKVGAHSYIYLENGQSVSDATLTNIMNEFDNNIYLTDTSVFGSEPNPGIDGDSHVYILLLDILDGWTGTPPHTGYIGGYFWSGNEYPTSQVPHSNEKEMFYMDIHPATPGSTQFYGTLAHEFQHMIHWNHDAGEETWVDEGCADLAMFVCEYGHPASHLQSFLGSPNEQLNEWHGGLEDYGSAYLWTLYFWEKYGGNSTITSLVTEPGKGIAGIDSVLAALGYSDRFKDAFNRWTVANYLDDTTTGTGFYGYASLDLVDSGADNVNSFFRPALSGSHNTYPASGSGDVKHWAADYYKFTGGASALTLNFDGYDDDIFGVNVALSTSSNFASGSNTVQKMGLNPTQDGSAVVSGFGTTYQAALLIPSLQSDGAVARPYSYSASLGPELAYRIYLPIVLRNWPPIAPTPTPTSSPQQVTLISIADSCVVEGYPGFNAGDTSDMWAGYDDYLTPDGKIVRSLVQFDLSGIPAGRQIDSASLELYLVTSWDYPSRSRAITTYRIGSDWAEIAATWSNKPSCQEAYGSNSVQHMAWGWYDFDVTALVQAWVNGSQPNYGIMVRGPEHSGPDSSWRGFSTKEGDYPPELVVNYTGSAALIAPTGTATSAVPSETILNVMKAAGHGRRVPWLDAGRRLDMLTH